MKVKLKLEGDIRQLEKDIKKLGKLPQTVATKAAKAGANIAFKHAKTHVPEDEGNMKRGLTLRAEKRTKMGKKVYFVAYKKSMNDIFVKPYADGSKRAYYPASQEYGFTVMGHYTPGYNTLRNSIDKNKAAIEKEVVNAGRKAVEKLLGG